MSLSEAAAFSQCFYSFLADPWVRVLYFTAKGRDGGRGVVGGWYLVPSRLGTSEL